MCVFISSWGKCPKPVASTKSHNVLPFDSGHPPSEPILTEMLAMAQANAFKSVSYIASQMGEIFWFKLLYIYLNEYCCLRNMIVIADQDEFPI